MQFSIICPKRSLFKFLLPFFILVSCELEVLPDVPATLNTGGPTACFTVNALTCIVGDCDLAFDAGCSTGASTYRWDFDGDGTVDLEGPTASAPLHTFTNAGSYAVRLEVENSSSLTSDTTLQIEVTAEAIETFETVDPGAGPASGLALLSDGGVLITGTTNNEFYLRRIDASGGIVFNRTYSVSNADRAMDVARLSDGSYVVVGTGFNAARNRTEILYLRTKANGDPLLGPLLYSQTNPLASINRVVELTDGSLLLVGTASSAKSGNTDMLLFRVSADLSSVDQNLIVLPDDEVPYDAVATVNGYVVVGSHRPAGGGEFSGFVATFDLDNEMRRGQPTLYDEVDTERFTSVTELSDGEILVAGTSSSRGIAVRILRITDDGKPVDGYPNSVTGNESVDAITSAFGTADGGVILAGQMDGDALLLKLNERGGIHWQQIADVNASDRHNRVVATSDGGYFVAGYRGSSLYYAKTDGTGGIN